MQFRSKTGPIPGKDFDIEVAVKKDVDDCYSPEFVAANKAKLEALKAQQELSKK